MMGTTVDVSYIQELHEEISKLCRKLEDIGCESLIITVTRNGYCQLGSQEGRKFLEEKFDFIMDFIQHCQENKPADDDEPEPTVKIIKVGALVEDKKEIDTSNLNVTLTQTVKLDEAEAPTETVAMEETGSQLSQLSEDLVQIEVTESLDKDEDDSMDEEAELLHYQQLSDDGDLGDGDEGDEEQDMEDDFDDDEEHTNDNVVVIRVEDLKNEAIIEGIRTRNTSMKGKKRKGANDPNRPKRTPLTPNPSKIMLSDESGTPVRRFLCDICNKHYKRYEDLLIHKRKHTGEAPFPCNFCSKTFRSRGLLRSHFLTHSDAKMYTCEICEKTFSRASGLYRHKLKHNEQAPYHCELCNKSFTDPSNFKLHKLRHTGHKPYGCDACEMRFFDKGSLVAHQRVHTGEKPFVCDMCGDRFRRKKNLTTHRKKHLK